MIEAVDCIVIGAGVVGLAIARELAQAGREVLILERESAIGTGVSSRNSEVIHAGLYYPPESLKARLCVEGREMLYRYLCERNLPHRRCGKLVVASDASQTAQLHSIKGNATQCGVADLEILDRYQTQALEPQLQCHAALFSPWSGIVDSRALMLSLLGDAERSGAVLALRSQVIRGKVANHQISLSVGGEDPIELVANTVVNAAGLFAQQVAHSIGTDPALIPGQVLARGNYFSLSGTCPFSHLIYPVPEAGGLGIHLTLDLAGQAKFGPDVQWTDSLDYTVDDTRRDAFVERIKAYWPAVAATRLQPAYAGIRPKLEPVKGEAADFRIDGRKRHGTAGLVHLFGIESPGLTASLAIAAEVKRTLED
jgi:L-2-hydroxyglutarate oxidase LhgO